MPAAPATRRFRPPLWATLGTVLVGGVFLSLGFWQLGRSEEKAALFARFDAGAAGNAAALPDNGVGLEDRRYAVVTASGSYDTAHQVLLDARTRDGRAGYEVLTPLRGAGTAVLVNRGWVPANPDRRKLPTLEVGSEPRTVTGLLDRLPRAALSAGPLALDPADPWPRVLLYPTADELGEALGYPVRDFQLLLAADQPEGYGRDWRPELLSPAEHVGYAVQWFALAGLLVVLYVALNWRKNTPDSP
jgi:surfeit locus 1 family protein